MLVVKRIAAFALMFVLMACGASNVDQPQRVIQVGMILARGGLGDRSFNDSAYSGLQQAQKELNIRFETIDFTTDDANKEAIRRLARDKYDLIIGVGFENAAYIKEIAPEFPDRSFAIIDAVVEAPNVASVVYREQEGDFLMGVLAAMLSKTNKIGFIGGADIAITRRIEAGFKQGVAYQNPQATVQAELAGTFTDPDAGNKLANAQYADGIDIIYNAAGRTGLGVIDAAKTNQKLTIGTSGDQRYLAPGFVVGNRPKRVDTAVLTLIKEVQQTQFKAGTRSLGLKESGLTLGPFDETLVTAAMRERLDTLQQQIIAGDIKVNVEP